ncbi:MAG: hypothetical protein V1775_02215 [Bacteroidota bacterium]
MAHAIRRCECGAVESFMQEFDRKENVWVKGNFVQNSLPLMIVAADVEEGIKAKKLLENDLPLLTPIHILAKNEQMEELNKYSIFFYGNWYDNPYVQTERFTKILNNYLGLEP